MSPNLRRGGRLAALVLNAHGYPGHLGLGTGIKAGDAGSFGILKGFVDQIYIVGCGIAGIRKNRANTEYLDGPAMCQALCLATNAYVIAPKSAQRQTTEDRSSGVPFGHIDDYEGDVLLFSPPKGESSPWNAAVPLARRIFLGSLAVN